MEENLVIILMAQSFLKDANQLQPNFVLILDLHVKPLLIVMIIWLVPLINVLSLFLPLQVKQTPPTTVTGTPLSFVTINPSVLLTDAIKFWAVFIHKSSSVTTTTHVQQTDVTTLPDVFIKISHVTTLMFAILGIATPLLDVVLFNEFVIELLTIVHTRIVMSTTLS